MPVFLERLPPLRGVVTPGIVGRLFRRLSAVNRRLDAENLVAATLVAQRKTERWLHFDLWGGATRYMNDDDNTDATALGDEFAVNAIVHAAILGGDASADLELTGWSIVAPDARFVFSTLTLSLERNGVSLAAVTLPGGLDEADSYTLTTAPFPVVLAGPAEELRVRVTASSRWNIPNALDGDRRDQVAQCVSIGFHFRRRPV